MKFSEAILYEKLFGNDGSRDFYINPSISEVNAIFKGVGINAYARGFIKGSTADLYMWASTKHLDYIHSDGAVSLNKLGLEDMPREDDRLFRSDEYLGIYITRDRIMHLAESYSAYNPNKKWLKSDGDDFWPSEAAMDVIKKTISKNKWIVKFLVH